MNFLFRILGIFEDAVNVVVVPTSVWQRMQDERNEALRERDEARAEAKRADEEATALANSDLATTEQVVRALRAENERLREACALALGIMEQKNKMELKTLEKKP
jgi:gamma-glutamylcysteine synthetase